MAQVPLPKGIKGSKDTPRLQEYVQNMLFAQGALLSRPAQIKVSDAPGSGRGTFIWEDELYSVFGTRLFKGTTTLTDIGEILGSGKISLAKGFIDVAIATSNTNYLFDGAISTVSDPDLPVSSSVTVVDSRALWVNEDGSAVFWSEVNDFGNVAPLNFFDAESSPDVNRAALNIKNDAFILGSETIERFRSVESDTQPFLRVDASVINVGYVSASVETRDSFMFIGKDRNGGYQIYVFAQGTVVPVSNDTINERLNTQYTFEQLRAATAQRFNWLGVDCYAFSLSDVDIVLIGGSPPNWVYFSSGTEDPHEINKWGYEHAILFNDDWYTQGPEGLYKFSDAAEDTSGKFGRGFQFFIRSGTEETFSIASLELSIAQSIETGSAGLSMSLNGLTWTPLMNLDTGSQYENKLRWNPLGGLGRYYGFAGAFVYTTEPIGFSSENIVIKFPNE